MLGASLPLLRNTRYSAATTIFRLNYNRCCPVPTRVKEPCDSPALYSVEVTGSCVLGENNESVPLSHRDDCRRSLSRPNALSAECRGSRRQSRARRSRSSPSSNTTHRPYKADCHRANRLCCQRALTRLPMPRCCARALFRHAMMSASGFAPLAAGVL